MSLPTTIIASGAGTSAANGTYTLASGVDASGNGYYQQGSASEFVYYQGNFNLWVVGTVLDDWIGSGSPPASVQYYNGGGAVSATSLPLTGWGDVYGTPPAPDFALGNPQVVSGGAAVSVPIVSGTGGLSLSGYITIDNPSGSAVASNGSGGGSNLSTTYTFSGWTVTTGATTSDPVMVTAPAGLTPGTGWHVGFYTAGGYVSGANGVFDIVNGNPQVAQGGSASFTLVHDGTTPSSTPGAYIIYQGASIIANSTSSPSSVPFTGQTLPSGSQGGYTLDASGISGSNMSVTLHAPSGATVQTGAVLWAADISGNWYHAVFDVVAGSSGTTLTPVSVSDSPLFTDTWAIGAIIHTRSFSDSLFSDSFHTSGVVLGTRAFFDKIFTDSSPGSHLTGATRTFRDTLFTDSYAPVGVMLAPVSFSTTLFSDTGGRQPMTYATITFGDALFGIDSGGRTGDPSHSGGTTPPFTFGDFLFGSDSASETMVTGAVRAFSDTLFSDGFSRGAFHAALVVFSDTLFSDSAHFSGLILPGDPSLTDDRDPFVVARAFFQLLQLLQGDSMINPSKLLLILDKLAASYRENEAAATSAILVGLEKLIIGDDGISGTAYGVGVPGETFILKTIAAADAMVLAASPDYRNGVLYSPFLSTVASYLASVGGNNFSTLDTFATYQNSITPRSFLVAPQAAYLQWLYNNRQGALLMSPSNVFAPATTFGIATITGANAVSFVDNAAIPLANNATDGLQGYVAAPAVQALISTAINGSCVCTVTGNGQNAAGGAVTGAVWTATLSSLTAGQTATFVPSIAGTRISDVTSTSVSGTATQGAFRLDSQLERLVS